MSQTVIQYVLSRLKQIGVTDVFGLPGDFAFPVNDAICLEPNLRWIGCCNELNAAYAADGYARIKGVGAFCTTYGVGELGALAGVAGSYAEHLPVFHLVGMPNQATQIGRALVHHTLGNGEYDLFFRMTQPVVCGSAVMTPQNVVARTEQLIAEAFYHRRPVYMAFPANLADRPVLGAPMSPIAPPYSDPDALAAAVDAIAAMFDYAQTACILPGIIISRLGLQHAMQSVINAAHLPFATMFMDKSTLDEGHPAYIGVYDGTLMNENVREFVENCDCVLSAGAMQTDFNSGAFTAKLDPAKMVSLYHHCVRIGGKHFQSVEIGDILAALASRLPKRPWPRPNHVPQEEPTGSGDDPITASALYPRWARFLRQHDIVIAETGTVSMGLGFARMPCGASFHNQTLWGSIGWATPAAFGAAVAAPDRRVILITGEGAHQLTAQEICQFGRRGLRPIIFVLNNSGYLIERLLDKDATMAYNDVASWRYTELPHAFGCDDWFTARATTCGEFDQALQTASQATTGVYVEIVTPPDVTPQLGIKLHENLKTLYK
jgi:indolepyruvate decarboxylase